MAMSNWENLLQSLYIEEAEARGRFSLTKDIQASRYSLPNPRYETEESEERFCPLGISPVFTIRNREREGAFTKQTKTLTLTQIAPRFPRIEKPNKHSQVWTLSVEEEEVSKELVELDQRSPVSTQQLHKQIQVCQEAKATCSSETLPEDPRPF